ncbi:thiamine pyrophosphate-dependent enzyme [Escherichia coli]|uniref:thiamine pyrophosphate-dependent enzyme n=1 Tax=Escherichia coli TaxID=562 RepID=UPI003CF433F2
MAKMRAVDAAMYVLEKEGITTAFGVPGAAINPFYSAMRKHGGIRHILARHVEGASHMAEGYTRAMAGNIGVCLGTSGPAGTDMITALYSASADSIPILCITGQAPRARLHKEDFQAVDIEAIAKPVSKMAVTVREAALVPRVLQQAFHLMRSGRPGPVLVDLPFDVQVAEIEFDPDMYEPLPVYKPAASRMQIEKAIEMLLQAERPVIVAGGGVINADAAALLQQFAELTSVPVKPQRVYEEMNKAFGRDVCYVTTIGLSQIAAAQMLHVFKDRHWINCGQAGPLGWTIPAALGVCAADPKRNVVAISGDFDFQFLIEELAVGAQFNIPYIHVLVNNAYLGLIRQSQRAFDMDYCVQLAFENINSSEVNGYGVDHVKVAEGLGCKAIRVFKPEDIAPAFEQAKALMAQYRVPVVVEVILERVTNISMGSELDNVMEFEDIADNAADAPTETCFMHYE